MSESGDKRSLRISIPAQPVEALRDAFLARLPPGASIQDVDLISGALRFALQFARRDSELRERLDRLAFNCGREAGQLVADSLIGEGKATVEITPETGAVIVVLPDGERRELDPVSAATRDVSAFFGGVRA